MNIMQAIQNNDIKSLKEILSSTSFKELSTDYPYALHLACDSKNIQAAKLLIQHGFSLNTKDEKGRTPLEIAKNNGFNEINEYAKQFAVVSAQRLFREKKYVKPAYKKVKESAANIDIQSKSNENLKTTKDKLRNATHIKKSDKELLSKDELKLLHRLQSRPFKLRHITSEATYQKIMNAEIRGKEIIKDQSQGKSVIRSLHGVMELEKKSIGKTDKMISDIRKNFGTEDNIYFSIGIGEDFHTPLYMLKDNKKFVMIDIDYDGISQNEPYRLQGIWGSDNLVNYDPSIPTLKYQLCNTEYQVAFDKNGKHVEYQHNGKSTSYDVKPGEEIVSGDQLKMKLLYDFIIWLREVNGSYYQYVMDNMDNNNVLDAAFNMRFSANQFEVLLPAKFFFDSPQKDKYVKVKNISSQSDVNLKSDSIYDLTPDRLTSYVVNKISTDHENIESVLKAAFIDGVPIKEDKNIKIKLDPNYQFSTTADTRSNYTYQIDKAYNFFHWAVLTNNVNAAKFFIEKMHIDPNLAYLNDKTVGGMPIPCSPLYAAINNSIENNQPSKMINLLLENGAKLDPELTIMLLFMVQKNTASLDNIDLKKLEENYPVEASCLKRAKMNPVDIPAIMSVYIRKNLDQLKRGSDNDSAFQLFLTQRPSPLITELWTQLLYNMSSSGLGQRSGFTLDIDFEKTFSQDDWLKKLMETNANPMTISNTLHQLYGSQADPCLKLRALEDAMPLKPKAESMFFKGKYSSSDVNVINSLATVYANVLEDVNKSHSKYSKEQIEMIYKLVQGSPISKQCSSDMKKLITAQSHQLKEKIEIKSKMTMK